MDITAKIDFTSKCGKVKPKLHSSGLAPRVARRNPAEDELLRSLHLSFTRTHDWALVSAGQRLCDTHFIFPLAHLDPKDPKNYVFEPTDHALSLAQDVGMKIFFRLGSSIEHSGDDWGFNTLNPENHERYAEVLAGIVRHYTQGWANGFKWDIKYWELFNEPDIWPCWRGTREEFLHLFITCFKRLKSEFPKIKIGGPAFATCYKDEYINFFLKGCADAGVKLDFFSWHGYAHGNNMVKILATPERARNFLDSHGMKKCELIINEWHYVSGWSYFDAFVKRGAQGVAETNSIDSAVYNLTFLSKLHDTPLDQAFYYGCNGVNSPWGYSDSCYKLYKTFFSLRLFGEIVSNYVNRVKCESFSAPITPFAALSKDGKKGCILISDYRGLNQVLELEVKGIAKAKRISAVVLDNERDNLPIDVDVHGNYITLVKSAPESAAFLISVEW